MRREDVEALKHCQISFHPSPGHYEDCPILSGEPQHERPVQELVADALSRLQRHWARQQDRERNR